MTRLEQSEHEERDDPGRGARRNGRGPTDYRELVIDALAGNEAALIDRLVDLSLERDQYQELFKTTLHALADLTRDRNRYRRQYYAVLEERRAGGAR